MRLYDTATRSLVELPAAPGPIRMYFCGPTVYARAHIGNARPFVVGMWLRSWLRETGYDAEQSKKQLDDLKAKGMQANELSASAVEEFKTAAKGLYPKFSELIGKDFFDQAIAFTSSN